MAIIIGADAAGSRLKDVVKDFLVGENFEVVDVTKEGQDFVDVTLAVAAEVNKQEENLGIVIDAYGAGPFMVATKIKGMVAAEVSDERSAYMTRGHNNSRMITMGAEIVGEGLAKNIAKRLCQWEIRRWPPPNPGRHAQQDVLRKGEIK